MQQFAKTLTGSKFFHEGLVGGARAGVAAGAFGKATRAKTSADARRINGGNAATSPSARTGSTTTPFPTPAAAPTYGSPSGGYGGTLAPTYGSPTALYGNPGGSRTPVKPLVPDVTPRHPAAAAPPQQTAVDPLAPLTDEQMAQRAKDLITSLISPQVKQVTDAINARTTAGQDAITGYTNTFAPALQKLAGIGGAGYDTAKQEQAAVDSALQQSLSGAGSTASSELGAKLAAIGAPDAANQAAATGALGTGAGNAQLAQGSAALSALIARAAGASDVAGKQPGIAALFGGQATRDLQAQAARDTADKTGQLTAQVPGLVQSFLGTERSNEITKAGMRQSHQDRVDAAAAKTEGDLNKPSASFTTKDSPYLVNAYGQVLTNAQGQPAANPGYVPPKTAAGKSDPLAKPDINLTKASSSPYILNGHGQPLMVNGKPLKYAPSAAAAKPATTTDTIKKLKVAVPAGGWNPKTQELSPEVRDGIKTLTGIDPGPTATRQELVDAGLLPKAAVVKPQKPDAKLAPNPSVTRASSSKVMLDGYGHVYDSDPKTPGAQTIPVAQPKVPASQTPAAKAAQVAKTKASAETKANTLVLGIVKAGTKPTGVYAAQPKTNAFGDTVTDANGKPVMTRTRTGDRFSQAYYKTLHEAEAAVSDLLKGEGYSDADVIRFVQKRINTFYDPGQAGRPRTAAQAEKAAPTPPQFPAPKKPGLTKPPKPKQPRKQFAAAFPFPG